MNNYNLKLKLKQYVVTDNIVVGNVKNLKLLHHIKFDSIWYICAQYCIT